MLRQPNWTPITYSSLELLSTEEERKLTIYVEKLYIFVLCKIKHQTVLEREKWMVKLFSPFWVTKKQKPSRKFSYLKKIDKLETTVKSAI